MQGQHQTNNSAVNGHGGQPRATRLNVERTIDTFESPEELAEALATLHGAMEQNVRGAALLLGRKDSHFKELKFSFKVLRLLVDASIDYTLLYLKSK